ncbi:hypothetical protein AC579_7065 [Pseudocercospora musae]|uniref:MYND-type domain-containing protein n=1 Tax=Pseudocercospora musae TaxID=113226 RepID=A0A139I1I8_9PEZI|nr:hypothetical protein AC579_7065 [Pseudocercospora musae]
MPLLPRHADFDPSAPLPEGQVWAVMIRPSVATETEEAGVEFYKLPVSIFHHAWISSEIAKDVGFPLQLAQWQHRETSHPNPAIANALFFSTARDETFGTCSPATQASWSGDVVAIRADGKELPEHHVKALLAYLSHTLYPLIEPLPQLRSLLAHGADTDTETREALQERFEALTQKLLRKLSAPVFHLYFEQYRNYHASEAKDEEVEEGEMSQKSKTHEFAWLTLPSPVQMTLGPDKQIPTPCGVCDGIEGKMMRCGPCKAKGEDVWYCGKECQREDWKGGHKDFCGRKN